MESFIGNVSLKTDSCWMHLTRFNIISLFKESVDSVIDPRNVLKSIADDFSFWYEPFDNIFA